MVYDLSEIIKLFFTYQFPDHSYLIMRLLKNPTDRKRQLPLAHNQITGTDIHERNNPGKFINIFSGLTKPRGYWTTP